MEGISERRWERREKRRERERKVGEKKENSE